MGQPEFQVTVNKYRDELDDQRYLHPYIYSLFGEITTYMQLSH